MRTSTKPLVDTLAIIAINCLLVVTGVSSVAAQEVVPQLTYRYIGPSLYVRTPWDNSRDKVTRIFVGYLRDGRRSGTTDFVSEHLQMQSVPLRQLVGTPDPLMRLGSDESPAASINGQILGGNHKIDGRYTTTDYSADVYLDGEELSLLEYVGSGEDLRVTERYTIQVGEEPPLASVKTEYTFSTKHTTDVTYELTALQLIEVDWAGGIQSFKPKLPEGGKLALIVPETNLADGIDVTEENVERFQPPEDWDDPSVPPSRFIYRVYNRSNCVFDYVMQIEKRPEGSISTSFLRSAPGKFYPRAFEGKMEKGEVARIEGSFGSVPIMSADCQIDTSFDLSVD